MALEITLVLGGIIFVFAAIAYLAYRRVARPQREYEAFIKDLQSRINNSDAK